VIPPRKKRSKGVAKLVHGGFSLMWLEPSIVKSGHKRDALAKRMQFKYAQQHVKDGNVVRTEIKYISLDEIVHNTQTTTRVLPACSNRPFT
jgi:hypothetical protein